LALTAAQRFFAAAAIFARASGLIVRFALPFLAGFAALPEGLFDPVAPVACLVFAHRARCAAAIRSRASGDIVRFFVAGLSAGTALVAGVVDPSW